MKSSHVYILYEQSFAEAGHISQRLQVDFDGTVRNMLEKSHYYPGVALVLGSFLCYMKSGHPDTPPPFPGIIVPEYFGCQEGKRHILDDIGFSEIFRALDFDLSIGDSQPFVTYFVELLEDPERSKTHVFDQQRYATTSKECLQLCLCSHRDYSKGALESVHRDKALCRSRPWLWRGRLGVHSRVRKGRHHIKFQQGKALKARGTIKWYDSFLYSPLGNEYRRVRIYKTILDFLPFFLERSAISLELAEVLRRRTFTTMGQNFPRRMRLAKEAMSRYLLRVESGVGES